VTKVGPASVASDAMAAGRTAMAHAVREVTRAAANFDHVGAALELLLATSGRVVVTGLGKSGLVGAKLAATLASTGTPAFFVHAADALHGDAGMVAPGDVLLAISKSGSTSEVTQFARMARGRGIPVVAMTGCGGSSELGRECDALVDVGVECEADPHDLAPTTSTSVTAVVGDALAVALMVAKGFGPGDFHGYHPAGALGTRLEDSP
jgi:arabinose-5-phosphate isomerase